MVLVALDCAEIRQSVPKRRILRLARLLFPILKPRRLGLGRDGAGLAPLCGVFYFANLLLELIFFSRLRSLELF